MNYYPPNRKMPRSAEDRFFGKVSKGDCWEWMGLKFWDGYGRFYVDRKAVRAHRWSYEFHVGPIPEGLVIDHLCRNRACVNPEHMEPVTNAENLSRGESPSAQAARRTHCPAGHPYSEENTYSRGGYRQCRTCHRERERARRAAA